MPEQMPYHVWTREVQPLHMREGRIQEYRAYTNAQELNDYVYHTRRLGVRDRTCSILVDDFAWYDSPELHDYRLQVFLGDTSYQIHLHSEAEIFGIYNPNTNKYLILFVPDADYLNLMGGIPNYSAEGGEPQIALGRDASSHGVPNGLYSFNGVHDVHTDGDLVRDLRRDLRVLQRCAAGEDIVDIMIYTVTRGPLANKRIVKRREGNVWRGYAFLLRNRSIRLWRRYNYLANTPYERIPNVRFSANNHTEALIALNCYGCNLRLNFAAGGTLPSFLCSRCASTTPLEANANYGGVMENTRSPENSANIDNSTPLRQVLLSQLGSGEVL